MSFQNLLESYFHPTFWWESYRENGKRKEKRIKKRMESQTVWIFVHSTYLSLRCDLLEIGSKSYRVIRGDCTLKKHQAATLSYTRYLVSFLPDSIVACYQCTSLTFLSVVSELFLRIQNKFGNQILGKMKSQGDMHSAVTFHLAKHLTNAVINTYTLPWLQIIIHIY